MDEQVSTVNREHVVTVTSGWTMLPAELALLLGGPVVFVFSVAAGPIWPLLALAVLAIIAGLLILPGFFTLQPNEARVLVLFGHYMGTVREAGFHWANPFYSNGPGGRTLSIGVPTEGHGQAGVGHPQEGAPKMPGRFRVSLRARNMNSERLKVNDKRGNPIEIAAVIVWRVHDTAQAMFDVDNFENYVRIQSESAIRHLASAYAYDHGEENEVTLRSGVDEVSQALRKELQDRLDKAGVTVEEARLTHLAYAPEIAQAMLRRQQAEAVIAARQKIVHGAVSMVDMALKELAEKQVVQLDDERKAAMVSNLMVVLCGESEVHPVVNTGTLYT
jgi:regulator of protease activity HflC (stomatin/prohibitin superfamily)